VLEEVVEDVEVDDEVEEVVEDVEVDELVVVHVNVLSAVYVVNSDILFVFN